MRHHPMTTGGDFHPRGYRDTLHLRSAFQPGKLNRGEVRLFLAGQALSLIYTPPHTTSREKSGLASIITDISRPRVRRRYPKDVLTQHVMPSARHGSNAFLLGVDVHGQPTQEADERQTAVLGST